jgi:hypothetical protein
LRLPPFASVRFGVGRSAKVRRPLPDFPSPFRAVFPWTVGVGITAHGKDPKAVATMRGADVVSTEHAPSRIIPERGQVREDFSEPGAGQEAGDVFKEPEPGTDDVEGSDDVRPSVPLVLGAEHAAGEAVWLAGETAAHDVDAADPGGGVEVDVPAAEALDRSDVAVDGERREESVALTGGEDVACVRVDIDGADAAMPEEDAAEDAAATSGE